MRIKITGYSLSDPRGTLIEVGDDATEREIAEKAEEVVAEMLSVDWEIVAEGGWKEIRKVKEAE